MNAYLLYFAALLALAVGIVHSVLGEKYILVRLFRRDNLPRLFGGTDFTIRTLRFAWHLTTVAWWGFAAILLLLAHPPLDASRLAALLGWIFLAHFAIALIGSHARHPAWIAFLAISAIAFYTASA